MEKEKDNNWLIIGIVIFLSLCLIAVFYFMFKIINVENKTANTNNEQTQTETQKNNEFVFTELTKYTLEEGEEKEITVDGKTIKISKKENKYYINDKEINDAYRTFYIAKSLILFSATYQFGEHYDIYNNEAIKIKVNENEDEQYTNIRIKNNKLYVDSAWKINGDPIFKIGNLYPVSCSENNVKDISSYANILEEHKNDELNITYEIKYNEQEVNIEKAEDINTIEKWIDTFDKVCVIEQSN